MIEISNTWIALIKGLAMVAMFLLIIIVGTLPIRSKTFRSNERLLSYASAFSGGLFLAVGLIHLIPEANECFEQYYEQNNMTFKILFSGDHYPFSVLITALSFAFVLFLEKILTDHHHSHEEEEILRPLVPCTTHIDPADHFNEHGHDHSHDLNKSQNENRSIHSPKSFASKNQKSQADISDHDFEELDESEFKRRVQTQRLIAKRASFVKSVKKSIALDRFYT